MSGLIRDPLEAGDHYEGTLMTAAEFLAIFEPQTLALLVNPIRALREDTWKAHHIAASLGKEVHRDGRYRPSIWALVYQ